MNIVNGMQAASLNDVPRDVIEHMILPFVLNKDSLAFMAEPKLSLLQKNADKKNEDIRTIRSIRLVNKKLFSLINSESVTRNYIGVLAERYKQPEFEIAMLLKTHGASRWIKRFYHDSRSSTLISLLYTALDVEKKGTVFFLLNSCPQMVHNRLTITEPNKPLHYAAARGQIHFVKKILEAGAPVNERGNYEFTPLHLAVKNGHLKVAELLLDNGADYSLEIHYKHFSSQDINSFTTLDAIRQGVFDLELSERTKTEMAQLIRSRMPVMQRLWSYV